MKTVTFLVAVSVNVHEDSATVAEAKQAVCERITAFLYPAGIDVLAATLEPAEVITAGPCSAESEARYDADPLSNDPAY